jgi:hypothetical protein
LPLSGRLNRARYRARYRSQDFNKSIDDKDDLRSLLMVGLSPKTGTRSFALPDASKTIRDKKAGGEYLRNTETDVTRLDRTDWIMRKLLSSHSNYDGKIVAN